MISLRVTLALIVAFAALAAATEDNFESNYAEEPYKRDPYKRGPPPKLSREKIAQISKALGEQVAMMKKRLADARSKLTAMEKEGRYTAY